MYCVYSNGYYSTSIRKVYRPASSSRPSKRSHVKIWDTALRKEWDGLCEREVFEHDLTKQQLYDRGILPGKRLIGIRVIYETKVKNGEFERCKCRAVAQGFGFQHEVLLLHSPESSP